MYRKNFFIFCLLVVFVFSNSSNISFAQEDADIESAPGYEDFTGSTEDGAENIYLKAAAKPKDTSVKTPAQVANGDLAGKYTGTRLSCPYAFERDLYVGTKGEDVRLLQTILNLDQRTTVAESGTASKGQETTIFGQATKDAVKKFQALFIEYIGIANGRFGPRTRTVMNAVCNGSYKTSSEKAYNNVENVQEAQQNIQNAQNNTSTSTQTFKETTPPQVSLSANLNAVAKGDTFKVIVYTSEEIKRFTPESVIIDGGTVKEVRKLSRTSYTIIVIPNEDAKVVLVQIEAEKIEDLSGNLNENASNEIIVKVVIPPSNIVIIPSANSTNTSNTDTTSLNSLLDKIVASAPNCTYNSTGLLITGTDKNTAGCPTQQTVTASTTSYYSCYGQSIPTTQSCAYNSSAAAQQAAQQAAQSSGMSSLGEMLGKLLKSAGGGGSQSTQQQAAAQQQAAQQQQAAAPAAQPAAQQPAATSPAAPATQDSNTSLLDSNGQCTGIVASNMQTMAQCQKQKEAADAEKAKTEAAKADAAKNEGGGKNLDKVVKETTTCSSKKKIFCIDFNGTYGPKEDNYKLFLMDKNYLILVQTAKIGKQTDGTPAMQPNSCLSQPPSVKPECYNEKRKLAGCVEKKELCDIKNKGMKDNKTGELIIGDPDAPLKKEMPIKEWGGGGGCGNEIQSAGESCGGGSSSSGSGNNFLDPNSMINQKQPQFFAPI